MIARYNEYVHDSEGVTNVERLKLVCDDCGLTLKIKSTIDARKTARENGWHIDKYEIQTVYCHECKKGRVV